MTVDLTPVLQAAVSVSALAIGIYGRRALLGVAAHFKVQISQQQEAALEDGFYKMAQAGGVYAEEIAAAKGWDHPDVRNAAVAGGLEFGAMHLLDLLKQNGLDPNTPDGQAKIRNEIARVLPVAMAGVAQSPVTTNGPAAAPAPSTTTVPATAPAPAAG